MIKEKDYLQLIPKCVKKHFSRCPNHNDLEQIGYLGLHNGIKRYNSVLMPNVEAYIYQSIRNEIGHYIWALKKTMKNAEYSDWYHSPITGAVESEISDRKSSSKIDDHIDIHAAIERCKFTTVERKLLDDYLDNDRTEAEIARSNNYTRQNGSLVFLRIIKKLKKQLKIN